MKSRRPTALEEAARQSGLRPRVVGKPDGDLAAALHEVSNALTVVLGWLSDAESMTSDPKLLEALSVASQHARRGHSVARRAIGARVEESEGVRSFLSVAKDAIRAATPEAMSKGVALQLLDRGGDSMVEHPSTVLQILVNLLLNALSFSPSGSRIRLSCECRQERVVFRVQDEGPGVPEHLREGLFAGVVTGRSGGAGIGLAHSFELARGHGAALRLVDQAEGGACFELEWCVVEAPSQTSQRLWATGEGKALSDSLATSEIAASAQVDAPASAAGSLPAPGPLQQTISGMRVLVLEDDEAVATMVRFGLEARGANVSCAACVAELDELLDGGVSFDAALIDLSPIQHDPAAVLERVRGSGSRTPVILISGSAAPDLPQLSQLSGWVHKPFEIKELCRALQSVRRSEPG